MKRLLLALLLTPAALGATYNVALPGGGVLTVNGLPYVNPGITNSASVVWGVDGTGLLYATATGTNSSIVYVEGAAVTGPNFGLSTEIDPAVTASTNITFSLVNGSITTNKIDTTFYSLLMAAGSGDVTQAGNNTFTGTNIFQSSTTISNLTVDALSAASLTLDTPIGVTAVGTNAADARGALGVAYDTDVQVYRLGLLQAALALTADGHMVYHNGTLVTNLLSTTAGRSLLTSADAAAQRTLLTVGQLTNLTYSTAWSNNTAQTPTLGVLFSKFESLPAGSITADGVAITNLLSSASITNTVASGQSTLSIRNSGVSAGTYSNIIAAIGADGRVTSASSATSAVYSVISAGTLTATSVSGDGIGLTNLSGSNIASGTVAAARIDTAIARTNAPTIHSPTILTPTLSGPTLNDSVTYEQATLSAHSSVTNFVADPTVSPYQTINADLTTSFATVGFLHATNVAAGRQTTILVFAGTNASVTVSLAAQFARNTNSVALTTGQILPISFYGYGSSPTNVIATMGTVYTR